MSDGQLARLEAEVREHARRIFGPQVDGWRPLRTYAIDRALPLAETASWETGPVRETAEGVYICGDIAETPSIQGALASGRRAAEAVVCGA